MADRKTRDVAGILHFLTRQQMAEEIVRLDGIVAAHVADRASALEFLTRAAAQRDAGDLGARDNERCARELLAARRGLQMHDPQPRQQELPAFLAWWDSNPLIPPPQDTKAIAWAAWDARARGVKEDQRG
jgi:hypothetical protein